jgi:hypothetical protein
MGKRHRTCLAFPAAGGIFINQALSVLRDGQIDVNFETGGIVKLQKAVIPLNFIRFLPGLQAC